jgi:hypothetical protein
MTIVMVNNFLIKKLAVNNKMKYLILTKIKMTETSKGKI